ncbi:hypothetical protein D9M68_553670 [compost metagenome]
MPVAQKYMAGSGWPSARVTAATMAPNGPCVPALSMAITGMMVRKMPAKSLATSAIGPHSNWLSACTLGAVSLYETMAISASPTSRTRPGRPTSVPNTSNTTGDFQKPLSSTSATMPPKSQKLAAPSKPRRGVSGVGSTGSTPSLR